MGFSGIGVWQLIIVLAIVALLFGTKKLRGSGEDLGAAIRNFKQALKTQDAGQASDQPVAHVTEKKA